MMKKILIGILLLLSLIAWAEGVLKIKPLEAQAMQISNNAIIIDVRELDEIKQGMVKKARLLPLSLMTNNKKEWEKTVLTFPKTKKLIVYCGSGKRAETVAIELAKLGYTTFNMGGFDSWKSAGLPVFKPDEIKRR